MPHRHVLVSDKDGYSFCISAHEVKTPLDIYLQRHSPLSPDLWLHYSRLSARYISRHVPGADISLYPVSFCLWAHNLRICTGKTKGVTVRTFGSTARAAEIVYRGATLNTLSSFGFNCVYYTLRVEG